MFMPAEIFWLVLTSLMTALFWVPYIIDRICVRGLLPAMGYEEPIGPSQSAWGRRAKAAHRNAVENLVVFAALVFAVQATGMTTDLTATAAAIYFWARLVHFLVYVLAIPVVRTLAFAVCWGCQIAIALSVLGVV
jgi:uncharacterized MAPEG superfamily protein